MLPYILVFASCSVLFPILNGVLEQVVLFLASATQTLNAGGLMAVNVVSTQLLWCVGIHGQSGQYILNPQGTSDAAFLNSFVMVGGIGGMWGVILACFINAAQSYETSIAKLGLPLGLFNLSEIMVYVLPIVFNPYFLVPFLSVPLVNALLSDWLFSSGVLVLNESAEVPWFMPVFINGYLVTDSVAGAFWQVSLIAINALIYLPFVRANSRHNVSGRELDVMVKRVSAGRN